jgi:hypothetical protein
MKRLTVLLVFLAGCGSGVTDPAAASRSALDILRDDCWFVNELELARFIGIVEDARAVGIAYTEIVTSLQEDCQGNDDCMNCARSEADYVFFVLH